MKKIIVVSAINFFEGGPLTILRQCLEYLSDHLSDEYSIIALVHDKSLFDYDGVELVEFKKSRQSWFFRLFYEYIYFYFFSKRIKPYLWLSLHDITPNVSATIRAVYCHNASPFYKFSLRTFFYSYQVALFSLLYKYLYRINIKKNDFVIVQQDWIRTAFRNIFGIKNVIVSYPGEIKFLESDNRLNACTIRTFFYPSFPRVFKNIEVVAEAAKLLFMQGIVDCQVLITIDGSENKYARNIVAKYRDVPTIAFIGVKTRDEVFNLYEQVDALVFSSKLETWGLPLSEFKTFGKPMLIADLPYAHETIGDYTNVAFFDPDNAQQLTCLMKDFLDGNLKYDGNSKVNVESPFSESWEQLFQIVLP